MKPNFLKIQIALTIFLLASLSVFSQWTIDSLPTNFVGTANVQIGSKAIFTNATEWKIFDFNNQQWSSGAFLNQRIETKIASTANKAYIGGGQIGPYTNPVMVKYVDIYNAPTNAWSKTTLSQARIVGGAGSVGNKILFAGGCQVLVYSNRVDMFDAVTNVRTMFSLSQKRTDIAVGTAGTKILFAGGVTGDIANPVSSNRVDIYDDATGLWSTASLSTKREQMAVASAGTVVIFAGGLINTLTGGTISNRVDIYNASTNTWSTATLSEPKYGCTAFTVGNKIYVTGGVVNATTPGYLSDRIEIYDAATNTWSYQQIGSQHSNVTIGVTPKRIMFAGGITNWSSVGTDRIEVYDRVYNTWSVEYLSQPRHFISSASYGNQCIFIGGNISTSPYPIYTIGSKRIDIWTDPVLRMSNNETTQSESTVFPNPSADNTVTVNASEQIKRLMLFNTAGQLILDVEEPQSNIMQVDVHELENGIYFVVINTNSGIEKLKLIIQK